MRRAIGVFLAVLVCLLLTKAFAKEDTLNVFIIPHSHCDPGWLNTFEGYFHDQVNRILSNVVQELQQDHKRRFVWAEISFFQLWWEQQQQEVRDQTKRLVLNGQLEFIAGGWVQNDEANANFDIVIDQISEGHDFLIRTFGVVPRVAWQIDPFGHSSLTPSLFARMGFEAVVINRIHFNLKQVLKDNQQMEFLWRGSKSLGEDSEIFTHVLHTHYSAPQGFDWEEHSMQVSDNNVQQRASELANTLKARSTAYKTRNLLVTFGDDFKFQNAQLQFSNMDRLIENINSRRDLNVNIQYGTVSEYFKAVAESANKNAIKFPSYEGDFFPYADNSDSYWTGYYTTRPGLKAQSRTTDSILRAAEGLYALGRTSTAYNQSLYSTVDWNNQFKDLQVGRRNAALVQHHDGITGTAKGFVANDYSNRLDVAKTNSKKVITSMSQLLLTDKETPVLNSDLPAFSFPTGDEVYALVVHNPLGWTKRCYVKVTVNTKQVSITDHAGISLTAAQILPVWSRTTILEPEIVLFDLYFLVDVPALGLNTYFLSKSSMRSSQPLPSSYEVYISKYHDLDRNVSSSPAKQAGSEYMFMENEQVHIAISNDTGLIHSFTNLRSHIEIDINQHIVDYHTSRSGAYLMRPHQEQDVYSNAPFRVNLVKGVFVQQFCTYIFTETTAREADTTVCVRLFSGAGVPTEDVQGVLEVGGYAEVTYNIAGRSNRETVARYKTSLKTNGVFFTDNALEIRQRKNTRAGTEKDYYPTISMAYLQESSERNIQFTVLTRQAMGSHSPNEGVLEHMMHRNLAQDDGRGLGEPNNDGQRIDVTVFLVVQPIDTSVRIARRLALALEHIPRMVYGKTKGPKEWGLIHKTRYSPLASQMPPNLHLLSFKARDGVTNDIIFRAINIFETGQHPTLSQPSSIDWDRLFSEFDVSATSERSLALTMDTHMAQTRKNVYLPSGESVKHASGLAAEFPGGDKQNTDEEGVFISNAALEAAEKAKEEQERIKKLEQEAMPANVNIGRELQSVAEPIALHAPSIELAPMEIRSFFVQLERNVAKTVIPKDIPPPKTAETKAPRGVLKTLPPTLFSDRDEKGEEAEESGHSPFHIHISGINLELGDEVTLLLLMSVMCSVLMGVAYARLNSRYKREVARRKDIAMVV